MEIKPLHLASRDHAASARFYATYFAFRFDATFPRGDQPAATIIRAPSGFQIYLEAGSDEPLRGGSMSASWPNPPRPAPSSTSA